MHEIESDDDFAQKYGDLGLVYGSQWRKWKTSQGDTIDQIANVIQQIKTTPDSRRMIVSAWNPEDVPSMALPPCHTMFHKQALNRHTFGQNHHLQEFADKMPSFLGDRPA